ncbi:hypothetical protein C8R46DRAFT_1037875 [Mycena filopes]|nr:hypothetical protein C8R46DRAFT_1037875 [Mycena filopes]
MYFVRATGSSLNFAYCRCFLWQGGSAVPAAWAPVRNAAGKPEAERNTATAEPGTQRPLRVREEETQSNQAGGWSEAPRAQRARARAKRARRPHTRAERQHKKELTQSNIIEWSRGKIPECGESAVTCARRRGRARRGGNRRAQSQRDVPVFERRVARNHERERKSGGRKCTPSV